MTLPNNELKTLQAITQHEGCPNCGSKEGGITDLEHGCFACVNCGFSLSGEAEQFSVERQKRLNGTERHIVDPDRKVNGLAVTDFIVDCERIESLTKRGPVTWVHASERVFDKINRSTPNGSDGSLTIDACDGFKVRLV